MEIVPLYEYDCKVYRKDFLIFLSLKEEAKPKITCPHCGSDHVENMFPAFLCQNQ
jgi:putative FmdB family regulatory protein